LSQPRASDPQQRQWHVVRGGDSEARRRLETCSINSQLPDATPITKCGGRRELGAPRFAWAVRGTMGMGRFASRRHLLPDRVTFPVTSVRWRSNLRADDGSGTTLLSGVLRAGLGVDVRGIGEGLAATALHRSVRAALRRCPVARRRPNRGVACDPYQGSGATFAGWARACLPAARSSRARSSAPTQARATPSRP
jgi:hypothetical protein